MRNCLIKFTEKLPSWFLYIPQPSVIVNAILMLFFFTNNIHSAVVFSCFQHKRICVQKNIDYEKTSQEKKSFDSLNDSSWHSLQGLVFSHVAVMNIFINMTEAHHCVVCLRIFFFSRFFKICLDQFIAAHCTSVSIRRLISKYSSLTHVANSCPFFYMNESYF